MAGEFGDRLVIVEYHPDSGDPYYYTWSVARKTFYGVGGYPTVRIDGLYSQVGTTGSCSGDAAAYRSRINQRLTATGGLAQVSVEGVYALTPPNLHMSVTFTKEGTATLASPKVYLVVMENGLHYGSYTYNHVVRSGYDQTVSLPNQGDMVTVEHDFTLNPTWITENIECAAFIQSTTGTKEIYQTARIEMASDFDFSFDPNMLSVPQGNGTAEFAGTLTNISEEADELTLTLNNTFGWPAEFMAEGEAGFHATPSTIGLDSQESVEVRMRVHTDSQVRIGQGSLQIYSAVSERTQDSSVRLFNASPAILLVDDDPGTLPTQQTFIDALNARPYLFDTWDVHAQADVEPVFDDMKPYDIVLWMNGYASYQCFTAASAEQVMDFMDLGKGFIFSSQDALSWLTAGSTFLVDYLGIGSFTVNVHANQANGIAADPIGDGLALTLSYQSQSLNKADQVNANAIGTTIFTNEASQPIAVRADNGTARSVTLAFAGECVVANPNPNNCATLTDRAIQWIMQGQGQGVEEREVGLASHISGVSPNPLSFRSGRGEAAIQLRLSNQASQSPVRVDILDLNGRLVNNVLNGPLPSGPTAAAWSGLDAGGRPVASGVYYARLTTSEGTHSARMVVMR